MALSQSYARRKGYTLDDSVLIDPKAISGYTGEHRTKGILGEFLKQVRAGAIPKGSLLLVESLDRLSRESVLDAFQQFVDIIRNGVVIVTLGDVVQEYSKESMEANFSQLMLSILIMSRAHEESLQKSLRVRAAWDNKRVNIKSKPLTARCPAWLVLNKSTEKFDQIKARCRLVERIFKMALKGYGKRTIAIQLNQEKVPAFKGKRGWYDSYIYKILVNRAVIGEFQPHVRSGPTRVRKPVGEPVPNYYPAIVSDKLFYGVQAKLKERSIPGRRKGRTGDVRNLFSGLAKCAHCGSPMHFVNKGAPPKGGLYLVCSNARRGVGCIYLATRYEPLERSFLLFCSELDLNELLGNEDATSSKIADTESELIAVEGKFTDAVNRVEKLTAVLSRSENDDTIKHLLSTIDQLNDDKKKLEIERRKLEGTLEGLLRPKVNTQVQLKNIKSLLDLMNGPRANSKDLRFRLRTQIHDLVESIQVLPAAPAMTGPPSIEALKTAIVNAKKLRKKAGSSLFGEGLESQIQKLEEDIEAVRQGTYKVSKKKTPGGFNITFKSGKSKWVSPTPEIWKDVLPLGSSKPPFEIQEGSIAIPGQRSSSKRDKKRKAKRKKSSH